jgi:hypothetical protein
MHVQNTCTYVFCADIYAIVTLADCGDAKSKNVSVEFEITLQVVERWVMSFAIHTIE